MKTYQQFILEATTKSDKLTDRLKMLYNLPSDKKKYFKQQNPPEFDRLKKARAAYGVSASAASPQVAQLVSPGKSSQLKFPGTSTGINIRLTNTENEMKGVKSQAELIKKLGFKSLKDIDDRNP